MRSEVKVSRNRLQITRTFDAPRNVVFGWWSQPEKLQQWSGCRDALKCEIEMDFRTGGFFKQKMQIAGHGEVLIAGRYAQNLEPQRIVFQSHPRCAGPLV